MNPLLPLESFRRLLGFNPWHFWGMADSDTLRVTSGCNSLVREYAWQNTDAIGRSEIREAIATAEQRILNYLRYRPAPAYASASIAFPEYFDTTLRRISTADASGRRLSVLLPEGQVQALGVESLTLLGAAASITFSDQDGDGYQETFTALLAQPAGVTNADEIALYFNSADRPFGVPVSARWRIEPITVTIAGGTITATGRLWLLVKPILYEGMTNIQSGLSPINTSTFITSLDFYRRRTNGDGTTETTSQGLLTWESEPYPSWAGCCGDGSSISSDPAAIATAIARVGIRDAEHGIVLPGQAIFNTTSSIWTGASWDSCRPPDRITIRYLAGVALVDQQMDSAWQTLVARMAAAEMSRPICACDDANRELFRWQEDLARTAGNNDNQFGAISASDLNNPFGTRRGHIYAWREIANLRQTRGYALG